MQLTPNYSPEIPRPVHLEPIMKKTVLWGWHTESAIAAIKSLQTKGIVDIVAWFGEAKECTHDLDEFLHQFKLGARHYSGAGKEIYTLVYQSFPEFMEIYSRVSFSMGKTYQETLHIFNAYFDFFAELLQKNHVEIVLFSNLPHFGVDFILYKVAASLNIKTVMSNQSLIPNRFFYVSNIDDFGTFEGAEDSDDELSVTVEKKHLKNLGFYMSNIPSTKKCCACSLLNDMLHLLILKKKKPMTLTGAVQKFQICRAFNKRVPLHAVVQVDLSKKFVYFPLQLQPELTTSALGGIFEDQLLAIERISLLIPEDWFIYAKENPKQSQRQRDDYFFQRLSAIDKAVYVSTSVNTYDLIENCQFVSTITGTAGWEAISGGKCALVFGKAWYKSLPGVFEYCDDIRLHEILEYRIDHDELEKRYNKLIRKTAAGVVDLDYTSLVDNYSHAQNAVFLEAFARKFI